jgi:hypothetical protein
MGNKFGVEAILYYIAAEQTTWTPTPAWVQYVNVKNVTNPTSLKEVDVTTRGSGNFEATDGRIKQTSIEFDVILDPSDANYVAFETAYYNNTIIAVADMSGDIGTAGSRGLWANCKVTQFNREEPIDGEQKIHVVCKPTSSTNTPVWKVVA